jgi:hypothetical protein
MFLNITEKICNQLHTTDTLLKNKLYLSNFQIGQLTAFLFTLTDSAFIKNPMFAAPTYTKPILLHQHYCITSKYMMCYIAN